MPSVGFGGAGGSAFTAFFPLTSSPIPLATGPAMANGSTAVLPSLIAVLVSGNGASRTVTANIAGASTTFGVANATSPSYNGAGCSGAMFNGGSGTLTISASGSIHFGRAGSGTTTDGHTAFGNVIGGYYNYIQSPATMSAPVLIGGVSLLKVSFAAPSDAGDGTISSYTVQYSTDPTFTTGVTTDTGASLSRTYTVGGGFFYVRVASSNECTAAAGTTSAWSPVSSVRCGVSGTRFSTSSGAEVQLTVGKRWNATTNAEVDITTAMRWDGVNGVEVPISN